MAASPWLWEGDGTMDIKTQPVSLTYCSNLNCIILTRTDNSIAIIDVNSGDIVHKTLVLDGNNCNNLQCVFNPVAGNVILTDGTCVGLRKDLNGIYLLKTALQTPVEQTRDREVSLEMTLPDMEHVRSGLQTCMKDAHEPHLSKMERLNKKINESIKEGKATDEKLQKWASCHIKIDTDLIHSTLNHMVSLLHSSTPKGPQLSSTSALLSQVTCLLPTSSNDQSDMVSTKVKMWSEVNRRKTFMNWPHKDYKWAVPDTMAQAGFFHQSDRRAYANSVDRAVCFTCNVGLVCWEPTDEPWSEHERHSPKCPFVRGECTENVPLSISMATSPAQFHNEQKHKISCISAPTSVSLMATSTAEGQIVVWDIRDELQVRTRVKLKLDEKLLSNDVGDLDDLFTAGVMSDVIEESTKEALEVEPGNGGQGSSGKASGPKYSETDKNTTAKGDISGESTGVAFEMASVAILKNNQEPENETPVIQTVLPEAMLISCLNTSTDTSSLPARPHILVCEIPADKKRSGAPSKLPKSDENKGKSKSVSYSTQLSFESEDEYYDPLFSVPSVFHGFNSPLKDAFTKSGTDKADATKVVKNAKVVQCLSVEGTGCDNLEVSQVIPYDDGSHVLFVLTKRKHNCSQETSVESRCLDENISEADTTNSATSVDNCDNRDNEGYDKTVRTNSGEIKLSSSGTEANISTSNGVPFDAKESCDSKESCTDVDNKSEPSRSDGRRSEEGTNSVNNNKHPVETEDSENFADELQSSSNTKYPEDASDTTEPCVSSDAGAMSNSELLKCSENESCEESNTSESMKSQGVSNSSDGGAKLSETSNDNQVNSFINEDIVENSESEPKHAPTENTTCERNYSVCLLLYRTRKEKGRTLLEDRPCKTSFTMTTDGLSDVFLLPDDAEDSFMPTSVDVDDVKNVYLAGVTAAGSLAVLDGLTLETITKFSLDNMETGQSIHRAIFCSGLGSFCVCTEDGKIHFLHLVKKNELTEELASTCAGQTSGVEKLAKEPSNAMPLGDLSLKTLKSLVEMTTFENLVPRYTAIVPIFWSEVQQEQQQRRHPQHLLQNSQGDASCHTRTWRLQKKGLVGGDQLFKLMLPRPCYVGHVDITFTINKSAATKNNLQVVLSKPRSSSLRSKPAQAFTLSGSQPTNDDIICGPVDLAKNLSPYGDKGHVVLTSPSLLKTKVRTLHVVFTSQAKSSGKGDESSGGRNGFSDLEEISITIRSLTGQFSADIFGALLEAPSFCPRVMDIVCEQPSSEVSCQERGDLQWFGLELLCWIAGICVHQPVSKESLACQVVDRLPMLLQSCVLSSSRSIAHKCSRFIVLCVSQLNSSEHGNEVKNDVLKAFIELLPSTINSESSGGVHWFFTLLTGMLTTEDLNGAGKSCMELLMRIAQQLDSKLTYHDRVLRASFSLYGTPLDPTIFDVSMETMGLFATSKMSDDLLSPKNIRKHSQDVDEIDLMDYIIAKNSSRTVGTSSKMEQLVSSMYGILEVEPLDFSCSSMSDGCKIDYCQGSGPPGGGSNGIGSLYYPNPAGESSTPMSALQDHVQQLKEHEKLLNKLQKQKQQLEEQHQELEELGGMLFSPMNAAHKHSLYEEAWGKDMSSPHLYKFPSSYVGMKTAGLFGGKAPAQTSSVKTNAYPLPPTRTSFQLPVPKLLTIEKLQTGARHFVVLDFGQSVRLTDIFIPTCPDLSSLVIDIWVDGEEKDLSRVTVSTDIGSKPLLLTDLLPPLTCRYLKISIFARHGTLRTKLILGEYFGYPVLSETTVNEAQTTTGEEATRETYLNLMLDDVFCQYGIACSRLESVLNSVEPGAFSANDKSRKDEGNVKQAYKVCMSLQLRLNFLEKSIQRLNKRQAGIETLSSLSTTENIDTIIEHASYSKLKVISDWLVHVLVALFGVEAPTDSPRMQWTQDITFETCQSLFTTFCVKGSSVSRARVGAVLLRTCGEQAWWGEFLAWVMERFFSLEQTLMFSQERLFLLLTSMSQLSPVQYPVISSALGLLEKLLSPILDVLPQDNCVHRSLDSRLLEWVTLYVSNLLDNFMDRSQEPCSKAKDNQGNGESDAKTTNDHANITKRWDFIVPRTANDAFNESLKDSCKGLKGSKKEMRKLKKQIATRQRRLFALHQQHIANKTHAYEDFGPSASPPSPFQITQWNKQFRQKVKKPLKDLIRLKKIITNNTSEPVVEFPYPSRGRKIPRDLCLPVMKGLLAVLLSSQGACSVDFFVLICKVLGCLRHVSLPRVTLTELASSDQLQQLLKMCVMSEGIPSSNWSSEDQWIRHSCTTLLQDLVKGNMELRPCVTTNEVSSPKPKPEPAEAPEPPETPTAAADTSIGDIPETEEPVDDSFAHLGMFQDLFNDMPLGSEFLEHKVSESTDPQVSEMAKQKSSHKTKDSKDQSLYSSLIVRTLATSEISTAEDCRLEISLEMKAEQELRRLAFTSRKRFLTGMDLKSGMEIPGIAVARFGNSGVESSASESSGAQSSEDKSPSVENSELENSDVGCSEGESSGVSNSQGECSDGQSAEVENDGVDGSEIGSTEENEQDDTTKTYHFVSECVGKLIVDSFKGCHDVESVMEVCLLLNDKKNPSFLVTQLAMEAFLEGLSIVEGKSSRFWNLAVSWLKMLLRQSQYVPVSGDSQYDYVTATNLVTNPRFPRVLGKMLTTCDMGDSGQNILGPSLVKNFKQLLKELEALTSAKHHGINPSMFQESLLDTLMYMTILSDSQPYHSTSYPLDVCTIFLEFFTQHFPTDLPFPELSKPTNVVDSILSLLLSYLSSPNRIFCVSNTSKKKFATLFPTPGSSQDSSSDPSRTSFLQLCLSSLIKLFPVRAGESTLSDNVVNEDSTMGKLLECLNMCRGESFELLEIGVNIVSGDLSEIQGLDKLNSIEDGIMKVFCMVYKHTKKRDTIVRGLLEFFSSRETQQDAYYHISELLLWILLKLLDNDDNFAIFCENGGIEVICSKLSLATSRALHPVRGVVSTVVHQLGVKIHSKIEGEKHLLAAAWESDKPLVNFAPYGTIHCPTHSASSVADNLISMTVPTRRARSAAWIHHFDHKATWCPLYINLPNTVIVHEVVIQPHSASLSNSTSYVVIELCDENSSVTKISPPLLTAGLSNIRLQLTTPQLASIVRLRFHRPRDSDTLGLNRIEILGTSFYGPIPAIQPVLHSQKASLNWSRALDYCLRRSHSLSTSVLETLSKSEGILDVLLKILWTFPSSNLKSCVEFILIKFSSSFTHVCARLLNHLLYGGPDLAGSLGVSHSGNSENELLYQLGIIPDDHRWERLKPMCEWLLYAENQTNMTEPQLGRAGSHLISKIRTTAAVIWSIKDDPTLCDQLESLVTEEKFRRIYEWSQRVLNNPKLKLTLDNLVCALCYVIRPYFRSLLNMIGPCIDQSEHKTDYSALATLARAANSSPGASDLLESKILLKVVQNVEKSCRRFMKGSKKTPSSTDLSEKSSQNSLKTLEKMLEFLTLCSGHHRLKDWLGSEEGSQFWPSLLTFLTDCYSRVPTRDSSRDPSRVSVCPRMLAGVQTTSLRYFKTCVSGHARNQQNLARVLHELLARDMIPKSLSGFLRRLVLELLLDDDHITLVVTCSSVTSQSVVTSLGNAVQSPLWHPRFGASNSCKLASVRVNTKVQEVLDMFLVNPLQQLQTLSSGMNDTGRKTSETLQDLAELFEIGDLSKHEAFTLTSSAFNVKHKRSNHGDKKKDQGSSSNDNTRVDTPIPEVKLPMENWLCCVDGPLAGIPLPKDVTVAQIMQTVVEHGQDMGTVCLRLDIKSPTDSNTSVPGEKSGDTVSKKPVSTLLEVFSKLGGLALIASHLPPRFSLDMGSDATQIVTSLYNPVVVTSLVPGHSLMGFTMFLRLPGYADLLLENQQNACFMLRLILGVDDGADGAYIPSLASSQSLPTLPFTILQRLLTSHPVATATGAGIRETALNIGVVHLLLTCLGLLSHHKPRKTGSQHEVTMEALKAFTTNNDLGQAQSRRRTASKQYWAKGTGFGTGPTSSGWDIEQALVKQKNEEEHITSILQVLASFICPLGVTINHEATIDDISLDVSDEDITNILPSLPEILLNSCLIPTLASYLRNDSVLDMARHVPLYRAVLGFVRCIAVCPNLVPLVHPAQHDSKTSPNDDTSSLCSLLTKMKLCVDTYGSRLRSSEKVEDSKKKIKVETPPSGMTTNSKSEDLENESLSLLIPDVQTTSMLVHKAVDRYRWEHLKIDGSSSDVDGHGQGSVEELQSTEERYSSVMMPLQFDTFSIVTEGADGKLNITIPYHFSSSVKSATSSGQRTNASRARRLAQEIASLSTSLPLSYSSSVFVRCDDERLDIMKVLITGPADTPYANGCFEFDVYFPPDYPSNPMHISFETTGNHRIRFNPNLYNDGKVCLSILNTWHGRPEEKWNSQTSSFLQVLVSIQSLILVPEPYFNEPGYERSRGTHSGTVNSREYDANIRQATVKWAMLEPLKNPCPCFKEVIERHFFLKKDEVLGQCDEWIKELETWSKEKRTTRSITHHLESLRRHTTQLRDEIAKLSESCLETPDEDPE